MAVVMKGKARLVIRNIPFGRDDLVRPLLDRFKEERPELREPLAADAPGNNDSLSLSLPRAAGASDASDCIKVLLSLLEPDRQALKDFVSQGENVHLLCSIHSESRVFSHSLGCSELQALSGLHISLFARFIADPVFSEV